MLNELDNWCTSNCMQVNTKKSNVVHFRSVTISKTNVVFRCGNNSIDIIDKYAKVVSQSAGRALGLLIAKYKSLGGMPYDVFTKLYDSLVWPVISYGAAIWGNKSFSCINSIQNRAMRFYLGTGKYTPTAAVGGDMGWILPFLDNGNPFA